MDETIFNDEWDTYTGAVFPGISSADLHEIAVMMCPEGCILVEDERQAPSLSQYQAIPAIFLTR